MVEEKPPPAKRVKVDCDSDKDDDEPLSKMACIKKEVTVKAEDGEPVNEASMQRLPSTGHRILLLTFRTSAGKDLKEVTWPISEDILAGIPKYASKLATAKGQARSTWRLTVLDDFDVRDKDRMLDVVDYLSSGAIKPVNYANDSMRGKSLARLVAVSGLARSLGVQSLVDAIGVLIAKETGLKVKLFVDVAKLCCAAASNVDVDAESLVGGWMRAFIKESLGELYAAGVVEQGGKLAGIMMEVVMEGRKK